MTDPLKVFAEITVGVPRPSMWQAAFAEAEEELRGANPAGVDDLDIARAAWDCLPDEEARDEALDELFSAWLKTRQDGNANARREGGAR